MASSAASDRTRRTGADRGQAVVELALALPLVCLLLLGVVQTAIVVRDQLLVQHAAREAARAASVSAAPSAAAERAVHAIAADASVSVSSSDDRVTVRVTLTSRTDVPLVGALMPDRVLTATATMAREPP
ncbi:MAG: TadE family type IV pilus minor pilin [Ilumatobacteraceae bacterium]